MRSLFLFITLLMTAFVTGQIPFSQANRTKLLFNPSLAGSKPMKQISLVGNTNYCDSHRNRNLYVSYDQPSKKMNSGVGVYYVLEEDKNLKDLAQYQLDESVLEGQEYRMEGLRHTFGFSVAPKLNLMSASNFHKARLTISPSFFLEHRRGRFILNDHFTQFDYGAILINQENIEGLTLPLDSSVTNFFQNEVRLSELSSGIGILVSTKNSILLFKIPFSYLRTTEQHSFVHHESIEGITFKETTLYSRPWFSWSPALNVGHSLLLKKGKKYFLVPMLGISVKQYFNRDREEINSQQGFYSEVIDNRKYEGINYLHGTLNVRIEKVVFGWSYTRSNDIEYSGLNLGYQTKKTRVFANINLIGVRQFELATQINLM